MKKYILISIVSLMLSSCNQNPIDDLESEITSGNIDTIPPLDIDSQKSSLPKPSTDVKSELKLNGNNQTTATDLDLSVPEFTPTPTPAPNNQSIPSVSNYSQATINTSKGSITFELFSEIAPNTVKNFLTKSQSGYYQGLTFHRVEDWVIQGGDPLGNGTGGGKMPTELSQQPFTIGSVGIARGNDINISNDSQFFICKSDCSFLTGQYTIFGQVLNGMEVVNQIQVGDIIQSISLK